MSTNPRVNWSRPASTAVLVVYWVVLVVSTHIPRIPPPIAERASDTVLHVSAFTVLAFLFALAWSQRGEFGWQQALGVVAILGLYAVLDEVTQPPFGRFADARDWIADVAGALCGVIVFAAVREIWRRALSPAR